MNEPEITLRRLGYDDECWRAEVCASNGLFVATFAFYTHPTELEPFAQSLITFPRDIHDEARFEQGQPKEPTYYPKKENGRTPSSLLSKALDFRFGWWQAGQFSTAEQ